MRNKYLLIASLPFSLGFASCNTQASHAGECISQKLTTQQKIDNGLFLDFYYGMTPAEFATVEQQLIQAGTLGHSDSTTKFMLVVNNVVDFDDKSDNADECIFTVTPAFEGCSLYAIDLEYIPINNYVASFKSFSMGERFKLQKIPYESTVKAVESAYKEKYGKAHVSESHSLGGSVRYRWKAQNKEINLYKNYGVSQGLNGKDYELLSGFSIEYRSMVFDQKAKVQKDSLDKEQNNLRQKQVRDSKKAI